MKKQILVPLDGSKLAEMALPHALAFARAKGYGLTLLRVAVPPLPPSTTVWGVAHAVDITDGWEQELREDRRYLVTLAERLRSRGVDVLTAFLEDEPALGIITYAENHPEVALIAMSTHGRSGLSRWVFGSVAEKVLHASPVPILLVRPRPGDVLPGNFELPEYNSVVVPLDGSTFAAQALDTATVLAASHEAKITLVSALSEEPTMIVLMATPGMPLTDSGETDALREYLEQNRTRLEAKGFTVGTRLEYGPPAEIILRAADAEHADLIVMATHGRTGLPRLWLGSTAMKVVQASTRPVLLVRAKERVKQPQLERAAAGLASLAF